MANLSSKFPRLYITKPVVFSRGAVLMAVLLAGILAGMLSTPALADAPATGVVVEGVSVPGLELGDTRAQVEASYGPPAWCQSVEEIGDMASCMFDAEGGGQVSVRYRGADGGSASNSPDDVVYVIRWYEQVSGWVTTAGINTTLARQDPDAVLAAYPNATVTYQSMFDWHISDPALGIRVSYHTEYLTGALSVSMTIFYPSTSTPPPQENLTRVVDIDLTKDKRYINATVWVQDHLNRNVYNATVQAVWTLPDGSQAAVSAQTDGFGRAYFSLKKGRRGVYTFQVEDVLLEGFQFDSANSVLSASISK